MRRRIAIRQIGLITAGAMLLSPCVREVRKVPIALKIITITGDQEAMLSQFVETIIPPTDIPGAKELNVHHFVLRMIDDCHDAESQNQFVAGLGQVDEATHRIFSKSLS